MAAIHKDVLKVELARLQNKSTAEDMQQPSKPFARPKPPDSLYEPA
jgi:hypothetical protein